MTNRERQLMMFFRRWRGTHTSGHPEAIVRHMGEELVELAMAIQGGCVEDICEEAADIGLMLTDLVGLYGRSLSAEMGNKADRLETRWREELVSVVGESS